MGIAIVVSGHDALIWYVRGSGVRADRIFFASKIAPGGRAPALLKLPSTRHAVASHTSGAEKA